MLTMYSTAGNTAGSMAGSRAGGMAGSMAHTDYWQCGCCLATTPKCCSIREAFRSA